MGKRIGFVGVVVEDMAQVNRVNAIISAYADMVTGRIGVPDKRRGIAVIGLLIEGTNDRVGAFTGKLGNVAGVSVKSALTAKSYDEEEQNHEA